MYICFLKNRRCKRRKQYLKLITNVEIVTYMYVYLKNLRLDRLIYSIYRYIVNRVENQVAQLGLEFAIHLNGYG